MQQLNSTLSILNIIYYGEYISRENSRTVCYEFQTGTIAIEVLLDIEKIRFWGGACFWLKCNGHYLKNITNDLIALYFPNTAIINCEIVNHSIDNIHKNWIETNGDRQL